MADPITKSITVKADVATAYNLWANFENFPHFMKYIKSVTKLGPNMSRWQMEGPLGKDVEWTAETTRMEPNRRIGWNTKDNASTVTTSGEVVFTPLADFQTEITVTLKYDPPAGAVGEAVAKIFSNPSGRLDEDLKNFKNYVEGRPTSGQNA
jgi:uncharacterized membrane protein